MKILLLFLSESNEGVIIKCNTLIHKKYINSNSSYFYITFYMNEMRIEIEFQSM